jgi:hypothetical protein
MRSLHDDLFESAWARVSVFVTSQARAVGGTLHRARLTCRHFELSLKAPARQQNRSAKDGFVNHVLVASCGRWLRIDCLLTSANCNCRCTSRKLQASTGERPRKSTRDVQRDILLRVQVRCSEQHLHGQRCTWVPSQWP